jgi:hypothetical protein
VELVVDLDPAKIPGAIDPTSIDALPTWTRDDLCSPAFATPGYYRKTATTRAWRILGPFRVETREGLMTCEDGWLAVDAHGNPYPIAADEFAAIYEPVEAPA